MLSQILGGFAFIVGMGNVQAVWTLVVGFPLHLVGRKAVYRGSGGNEVHWWRWARDLVEGFRGRARGGTQLVVLRYLFGWVIKWMGWVLLGGDDDVYRVG